MEKVFNSRQVLTLIFFMLLPFPGNALSQEGIPDARSVQGKAVDNSIIDLKQKVAEIEKIPKNKEKQKAIEDLTYQFYQEGHYLDAIIAIELLVSSGNSLSLKSIDCQIYSLNLEDLRIQLEQLYNSKDYINGAKLTEKIKATLDPGTCCYSRLTHISNRNVFYLDKPKVQLASPNFVPCCFYGNLTFNDSRMETYWEHKEAQYIGGIDLYQWDFLFINLLLKDNIDKIQQAIQLNNFQRVRDILIRYPDVIKGNYLADGSHRVKTENEEGWFPLHHAVLKGNKDIVRLLLSSGANINESCNGSKPLHLAIKNGYNDLAKYLIDSGADINDADKDGRTPLDLAYEKGLKDLSLYLRSKEGKTSSELAAEIAAKKEEEARKEHEEVRKQKLSYLEQELCINITIKRLGENEIIHQQKLMALYGYWNVNTVYKNRANIDQLLNPKISEELTEYRKWAGKDFNFESQCPGNIKSIQKQEQIIKWSLEHGQ